jgi:hypothetical protein
VRGIAKLPIVAALAVLLLAAGFAACGGGGDSGASTSEASSGQSPGKSNGEGSAKGGSQKGAGGGKSGSGGGNGSSGGQSNGSSGGSENFVPKHHHDSGGGSQQFRVKGGDNSIQEFGAEAESSELDRAAAALHGFLDARAEGDWAAACSYMSKSIVESFKQLAARAKPTQDTSCAGILQTLVNPGAKQALKAEAEQADVGSLRIEGERAFVIYTGIGGTAIAMPMAHEGGAWKVASLAGTPLS